MLPSCTEVRAPLDFLFAACTRKASDNPCQESFHQVSISPTHLLMSSICKFLHLPYCFWREPFFPWWRDKSWIHAHALLAIHSTSRDNKHISSASREKPKEGTLMAVKSSALITCNRSISAGRQIHFKSQRENSCKTKDVILRLLSTHHLQGSLIYLEKEKYLSISMTIRREVEKNVKTICFIRCQSCLR